MGFAHVALDGVGKGVKSLYYCRSKSIQRAAFAGSEAKTEMEKAMEAAAPTDYDECLACQ